MCSELSPESAAALCEDLQIPDALPASDLAERLGTKHRPGGTAINKSRKHPWMRGVIAAGTPATEFSAFTLEVLKLWLKGAAADDGVVEETLQSFLSES